MAHLKFDLAKMERLNDEGRFDSIKPNVIWAAIWVVMQILFRMFMFSFLFFMSFVWQLLSLVWMLASLGLLALAVIGVINAANGQMKPLPLIVSPPPFTLPCNVAVPPVLVMDTVPVVVKPAMLWVPVPLMVIAELPAVNVPLLVKLPPSVKPRLFVANVEPALMVRLPFTTVAAPSVFVPPVEVVRLL